MKAKNSITIIFYANLWSIANDFSVMNDDKEDTFVHIEVCIGTTNSLDERRHLADMEMNDIACS